jgi:putative flippase GtrA
MRQGRSTETAMSLAVTMAAQQQFIRYALVGLISNAILYGIYIVLTSLGMGPKLAMSLLYGVGVIQTFVFNKQWSFRFNGDAAPALMRYTTAYALGYVINISALILLVDQMELPHQGVQGVMIVVIAIMLFLAQRYWVFAPAKGSIRA